MKVDPGERKFSFLQSNKIKKKGEKAFICHLRQKHCILKDHLVYLNVIFIGINPLSVFRALLRYRRLEERQGEWFSKDPA